MGIRGLSSLVEKVQQQANIKDVAKKSKQKVIVIDTLTFLGKIVRDKVDHLNLAGFQTFKQYLNEFIKEWEKAGLKLIWFVKGNEDKTECGKLKKRLQNQNQKVVEITQMFVSLDLELPGAKLDLRHTPSLQRLWIHILRYDLGYEDWIFTSAPNQDADKACAALAEKYNAFGILTQDSDFMIQQMSPSIKIFSINHLNLETLDTVVYDRTKLAQHLGLSTQQLPLLATLKGNDFVYFKDLLRFHRNLTGKRTGWVEPLDIFHAIANYIRNFRYTDYERLAVRIFGDVSKASLLRESVESYVLTDVDILNPLGTFIMPSNIDPEWAELIKLSSSHGKMMPLMLEHPFEWSACLEDYRSKDLPMVADLTKGPRQRLYGILFWEKPGALNDEKTDFILTIDEWCMTGPGSIDKAKRVKPTIPPANSHPGLKLLWSERKDREVLGLRAPKENCYYKRWRLFSWIINPKLDSKILEEIPDEDLFMVCQLYLMQHEWKKPILREKEVKAFILMNHRLKSMAVDALSEMKIDFVPEARPVQLTTIYTRSILDMIADCVGDVIPRKQLLSPNKFEGALFHTIYRDLHVKEESEIVLPLENIELNVMYRLVTSNGTKLA